MEKRILEIEFDSFVKQLESIEDFVEVRFDKEENIFFYMFNYQKYGLKFISGKVYILKKLSDDNYHNVEFKEGTLHRECLFCSINRSWKSKPLEFAKYVENISSSWDETI